MVVAIGNGVKAKNSKSSIIIGAVDERSNIKWFESTNATT